MELDRDAIMRIIPHRPPFLFVDRITAIEESRIVGTLQVTGDEWFFPGHFPGMPIMPGVLIVEAMAQACAILSMKSMDTLPGDGSVYYFVGIDKARFKRPVEPGDQLTLKVAVKRKMKGIWMFEGEAYVGEELCCSAELMCTYKGI